MEKHNFKSFVSVKNTKENEIEIEVLKINWMKMSKCWQIDKMRKRQEQQQKYTEVGKETNILLSASSESDGHEAATAAACTRQHSHPRLK